MSLLCSLFGHREPRYKDHDARCLRCRECLHFYGPVKRREWSLTGERTKTGSRWLDVKGSTRVRSCVHCGHTVRAA